jgi:serine/threonine-protein kinase
VINPDIGIYKLWEKRLGNKFSEGELAVKIRHPNVIETYDYGRENGEIFIVMEYFPGQDLNKVIRRHYDSIREHRYNLMRQAAEGLCYLYGTQGIVHRDISAKNMMIDSDKHLKIIDFGLAMTTRELERYNITDKAGTAGYLAPEQLKRKALDERVDVYAFGVVLYELATGRFPFEGSTRQRRLKQMNPDFMKNPRDVDPTVPAELERLILDCLNHDKSARPKNVCAVRNRLRSVLAGKA